MIQPPEAFVANPLADDLRHKCQLAVQVIGLDDPRYYARRAVEQILDGVVVGFATGDVVREEVGVGAEVGGGFGRDAGCGDQGACGGEDEFGVVWEVDLGNVSQYLVWLKK